MQVPNGNVKNWSEEVDSPLLINRVSQSLSYNSVCRQEYLESWDETKNIVDPICKVHILYWVFDTVYYFQDDQSNIYCDVVIQDQLDCVRNSSTRKLRKALSEKFHYLRYILYFFLFMVTGRQNIFDKLLLLSENKDTQKWLHTNF